MWQSVVGAVAWTLVTHRWSRTPASSWSADRASSPVVTMGSPRPPLVPQPPAAPLVADWKPATAPKPVTPATAFRSEVASTIEAIQTRGTVNRGGDGGCGGGGGGGATQQRRGSRRRHPPQGGVVAPDGNTATVPDLGAASTDGAPTATRGSPRGQKCAASTFPRCP